MKDVGVLFYERSIFTWRYYVLVLVRERTTEVSEGLNQTGAARVYVCVDACT